MSIVNLVVIFPLSVSLRIPIDVSYRVWRVECVPSDDGDWPESKTDTGHECETYMWFDTGLMLYIFVNLTPVDICHLTMEIHKQADDTFTFQFHRYHQCQSVES